MPLVALMEQLWRRIKSELDVTARELAPDLRPSHVRLLILTPASGSRLGDLASKAGMTAQSLGEFVDTLSQAGYAEVVPDPADRRARLVRPTPRGAEIGQAMNARVHDLEDHWSQSFGDQQWRATSGRCWTRARCSPAAADATTCCGSPTPRAWRPAGSMR